MTILSIVQSITVTVRLNIGREKSQCSCIAAAATTVIVVGSILSVGSVLSVGSILSVLSIVSVLSLSLLGVDKTSREQHWKNCRESHDDE